MNSCSCDILISEFNGTIGILQQNTGVRGKLFLQLEGGDACRNLRECNTKISYFGGSDAKSNLLMCLEVNRLLK